MGTKGWSWRTSAIALAVGVLAALAFALIPAAEARTAASTVTLVDTTSHRGPIGATAAPGSVVSIKVDFKVGATAWKGTKWQFLSGGAVTASGCSNTGVNDKPDTTYTEYVDVALPEKPGDYTVQAHLYATSGCSGNEIPDSANTSPPKITILTPVPNPVLNLTADCALKVVLVLDESGSIGSTSGATTAVRNGAKAFIQGLLDTSVQVGVIEFNTSARTIQINGKNYNTVDQAYITAFATYVNGQGAQPRYEPKDYSSPAYYTNWQDALSDAHALQPDMVVFLTDGDPTAYGTGSAQPTTGLADGSSIAMDPAFAAADALRAAGTHLFAIGVGAAVSEPDSQVRLRAISGPDEFKPGDTLFGKDWTVVSEFSSLEAQLAALGRALCTVRVRVVKSVDETGAGVYVPADGWGFKGTVSVSPPATSASAFRWLAPGVEEGPPPPEIVTTRPGVTSAGGKLEFGWRPFPIGAASKMVLAEAVTPGYHFVSAECANNKPGGAAPTVTVDKAAATITVAGLSMNDDITCAVKNQKNIATIQIVKNTVGQPTEVALWVDGSTEPRKTGSGDFGTDPLTVSTGKHNVWETFIDNVAAALYRSTYSCTNGSKGSGTVVEGGVDLASGDNVTCTFTNTKTSPTVAVSKTASLPVLNEPGGQVQFTTTVVNTTDHPVTLTSLVDDVYGDLASNTGEHKWDSSDCATGAMLDAYDGQPGGADTYTCHFVGQVSGEAGSTHMDTVTAEVTDPTGETATGKDTATVEIRDVKPSIQVTKAADPSIIQDRGSVTFTAVVTNTSRVDTLHVDRLVDSIYGDLIRGPVKASCTLGGAAAALPFDLPVGESIVCSFTATVSTTQTDTIIASGTDEEGNRVDAGADAEVVVNITPPPSPGPTPPPTPEPPPGPQPLPPPPPPAPQPTPEPPAPLVLEVSKRAPLRVFRGTDGRAVVTYDIRVSNKDSRAATATSLQDHAPTGAKFTRIADQPSQSSCTIQNHGALLTCHLGTLVQGQSVGIKVEATVAPGGAATRTNTATATCKPSPNAPCKAAATASTRLLEPFTPPSPAKCLITARPKSLKASGKSQALTIKVARGRDAVDGATVVFSGPGIRDTGRTGPNGTVSINLTPQAPGVLSVDVRAEGCGTTRIGILAATSPSLTG